MCWLINKEKLTELKKSCWIFFLPAYYVQVAASYFQHVAKLLRISSKSLSFDLRQPLCCCIGASDGTVCSGFPLIIIFLGWKVWSSYLKQISLITYETWKVDGPIQAIIQWWTPQKKVVFYSYLKRKPKYIQPFLHQR